MTQRMTVTEALAEIRTISKRIEKKRKFIETYALRDERMKDPFEGEGGIRAKNIAEMDAIRDLTERLVRIRGEIQKQNVSTNLTLREQTRTIAEWLTWRKEVVPLLRSFHQELQEHIRNAQKLQQETTIRYQQMRRDRGEISELTATPTIILEIPEDRISRDIENMEEIWGALDGALTLQNSTTFIEV